MNKMQILLRQQTMVKTLGIMMVFAVANIMFVSCADESIAEKTNTLDKVKGKESIELAQSTVSITADAGMQLPDVSKPIDPTIEPTSRAVSLNEKYMPLAEGSELKARVFIVKEPKNARKKIGWSDAIDPKDIILGAGELEWNIEQTMTGGGVRLYSTKEVTFHWLKGNKKVNIKKGENWYICGIIGGEYNKEYDEARNNPKNNEADRKLAERLYHFYVDFDPNNSPKHNTIDKNGHIQVTAPFTTGWTKLDIKEDNKISLHQWNFKPMGTLLHFRIKRDEKLVPLEACRYTFASSQLTANGGFLMMPQTMIRTKDDDLKEDYTAGVDCEIRPWNNSIVGNFYWNYVDDMRPHFNNTSNQTGYEESKHANDWGPAIYEYRYTFDANAMRKNNKTGYDDFYVWGMPVPHTEQIGTSQMTAERGGFMLGCKQKKGRKYDYANEWLYAAKERELKSGEYNIFDFKQKQGKAFLVELGVCRPRYSTMEEGGKLKYPWANPLERLAVTNSRTEGKGFHGENLQHTNEKKDGEVYDWSVKGGQFKMRFIKKDRKYLPEGYHVPSSEDFGVCFPNIIKSIYEIKLYKDLLKYSDIKSAPNPYYELYSPNKDDDRDPISDACTIDAFKEDKFWQTRPLFYSYYMHNPKNPLEFYAIRFCGENKEASKMENRNRSIIGNRYRCVYRWRVLDAGGDNNLSSDKQGMRIVVQSRWIGHANVSVKDIIDERWWGKCSPQNPLYKADCYRVLPAVGYPHVISGKIWSMTFFTRVHYNFDNRYGIKDDESANNTMYYRTYYKDGITRKYWLNNKQHYGVRLMTDSDTDEFGPLAPRNNQKDMYESVLIHRPEDDGDKDWTYPVKKK